MSIVRSYRQLLRNGPLTRLLAGEFISDIGNWMYLVALVVIVYQVSRDPVVLGVVGAARVLPYVLLSIPAGMVADRFDRRYVLLTSDIVRGLTMVVLAWLVATDGPVWAIVALAIFATCFATLFYPAIGALIPSLVRDESEFGPANSLWSSLSGLAYVIGPAIGGLLVAASGLALAFVINALTFAVVAVVVWSLPPAKARREGTAEPEAAQSASATAAEIAGSSADVADAGAVGAPAEATSPPTRPRLALRPVSGVMVIDMSTTFVFNGLLLLFVVLASDVYRGGEAAVGYLNAAVGVGGVIGAVGAGVLTLRRRLDPPLIAGTVAAGVSIAVMGVLLDLGAGLVLAAVIAGAATVVEVSYTTVFQRILPDELRGRATGVMMTVSMLFGSLGAFTLPFLYGVVGISALLVLAGGVVIAGGFVGIALIGSAATREAGAFEAQLRRARGLAIFGGLPPARLEVALDKLQPIRLAPATVIIRQGDVADRFYILSEGHVTVTANDGPDGPQRVLRRLGPDDVFGEIGLLTGAPRSATVTADDDVLVLVLDGDTFVHLITSGPGEVSRFLDLYRAPAGIEQEARDDGAPTGGIAAA